MNRPHMKLYLAVSIAFISITLQSVFAQNLKPGFDKHEYAEILRVIVGSSESAQKALMVPKPKSSVLQYKSPDMGLDNEWELWIKDKSTAILCTRGSTAQTESWLANIYAAMVPASGSLQIDSNFTFDYQLAIDSQATVHVGYLISTAFLSRDMLPKIDSCYKAGVRDFIIAGHSQGGGISYLLRAYFHRMQVNGILPKDIQFKTYCSAAPKPGNLYFAYEFEDITKGGWGLQVANKEDWVPQMPLTVQTLGDLPDKNPVPLLEKMISEEGLFKRMAMKSLFKKMKNPSEKTVNTYQKFLGKAVAKQIKKYLPNFVEPNYASSNDYVRTGTPIVLMPDAAYYQKYKDGDKPDLMLHHSLPPYFDLAERY